MRITHKAKICRYPSLVCGGDFPHKRMIYVKGRRRHTPVRLCTEVILKGDVPPQKRIENVKGQRQRSPALCTGATLKPFMQRQKQPVQWLQDQLPASHLQSPGHHVSF